jgi:short-subunit dehydrogenase
MKNKKITKLISKTESNLKSIADQMSEEFAQMQENTIKRDLADFDQYKGVYEEVSKDVEPEPAKEPDLVDIAVDNIMKGVFK